MKRLLDKEQHFLFQLIKSCEYYRLNEKQSIGCINEILNRNISRRTYYLYKRKLYSHEVFSRLKESIYNSPLDRLSILLLTDDTDSEVRAKVNELVACQFLDKDRPSFLLPSQHHHKNDDSTKDKVKDILTKNRHFKERENLSKERLKSIPDNSIIREEFTKCGKDACNLCPHGPYFYAYWKDKTKYNKSKLRKKYLGATISQALIFGNDILNIDVCTIPIFLCN